MNQYRLSYVEAWSDDDAKRHLLSQWPHYMTLDDHEIANQFALDFTPASKEDNAKVYLREATAAYRHYVHSRHPDRANLVAAAATNEKPCDAGSERDTGPFWYCFDRGSARFFVLDTRTRRCNKHGQMIDAEQLNRLLDWMKTYKHDLKFVVASVPFVAEIDDAENRASPKWHQEGEAEQPGNPENDKWSAARFHQQRSTIIEFIAENDIEHLVFLTGDMHCCYHALMHIDPVRRQSRTERRLRYECITVHELAGGPVNQLQLANVEAFHARHVGRSHGGLDYEVVLDRFHGQVNAVMHLQVNYVEREQIRSAGRKLSPEVDWNVIRTVTDVGSKGWSLAAPDSTPRSGESTMTGRISFVRKRMPEDLQPWH